MVTVNVLVLCKSCKAKVPVGDLKQGKDGKYICSTCYEHGYVSNVMQNVSPDKLKKLQEKPQQQVSNIQDDRVSYFCNNCKFSFTRPSTSGYRGCPYCNKEHTVQKRESAQDLLKNVDDFFNV